MKKILILLTNFFTLVGVTNATEDKSKEKVVIAFEREFAGAKNATWEFREDFYKVGFEYKGERVFAFYSKKAELMCVTRYILSTDLPYYLQKNLKEQYPEYWISDLFEVSNQLGVSYYATVEYGDQKIVLESKDNSYWETFKKYKSE